MPVDSRALNSLELFKVLDYLAGFAVSEGGQRACLGLRPCTDLEEIHQTSAAFDQGRLWLLNSETRLVSFPPLEGLLAHLASGLPFLDLDDLCALRQVLGLAGDIRESMIATKDSRQWPIWVERCQALAFPEQSVSGLNRCLSDEGLIKDQASPELSLVRGELRSLHRQCSGQVKNFAKEYNILHYLQDEFMTISSDRYVLPLKSNFKGRLQGIIHDYSQTGDTCYFEPLFLVELNNRLQGLKREEREEERKILMYLTSLVRQELPGVRGCYDFLLELDVLQARAALGQCYDGHMAEFDLDRPVNLVNARHPLLLLAVSDAAQKALAVTRAKPTLREGLDNPPVPSVAAELDAGSGRAGRQAVPRSSLAAVPSDIILKNGQQALVISGGNAGGKTVCLKTLGIIALMGMCGLPVPVDRGSSLPFWTGIHAFIGDEQSLSDHVSTFTAQITHLAAIWERLGPSSLIILDEFGAGTDPSQGAALAQAVVDAIMDRGAYVVAATHFPALKAYALSNERVRAASVMFDPKTKKPLFKLIYDQVGASQALDVAREHGLPEDVLRRAEQYLLISGEDTSALVERLNSLAVEREKELEDLRTQQADHRVKSKKQLEVFEREKKRLFEEVRSDAAKVLDDWKSSRSGHKQTLKELSRIRNDLAKAGPDKEDEAGEKKTAAIPVDNLFVGQRVRHLPWNKAGSILEIDARKNRVRLDLNGVSLWAGIDDLDYLDGQGKTSEAAGKNSRSTPFGAGSTADSTPKGHTGSSSSPLPLRLDIRGMRADVAIAELAKFLDSAVLTGREEVEVIHGRGTGVLRKEVHNYLKISPNSASYRLGNEKEGGDGVTFVTLH